MTSLSRNDKAKRKDIAELIRLMTAQREELEPNVGMFVQQTIAMRKGRTSREDLAVLVRKRIQNESDKLLAPFDEVFTHDEIMLLISFYKEITRLLSFYGSEAMKKLSKHGRKLIDPIYDTYRQVIEDTLN